MNGNPLKQFWNILSNILGIIGLVSLSDNLVAWKEFIPQILTSYQAIIYFPFKFFDIKFNEIVIDYLFIGTLCGSSFVKAIDYGERNKLVSSRGYPKIARIFYFILYLIFWPLGLIISIGQIFIKEADHSEKQIKTSYMQWFLSMFLFFFIVLIINSIL